MVLITAWKGGGGRLATTHRQSALISRPRSSLFYPAALKTSDDRKHTIITENGSNTESADDVNKASSASSGTGPKSSLRSYILAPSNNFLKF